MTLLLTAASIAGVFTCFSYFYYLNNVERGSSKDNLMYVVGEFVDDMWFFH